MKSTVIATLFVSMALVSASRAADVTVKLSEVHLCCGACVSAVDKTIADANLKSVTAKADRTTKTIALTGADIASVQKATDALVAGGVFGKSDNPAIKVSADTGAKGQKVHSLKIEGVHLCCGQCVSAVDEVVKKVAGVKEHDAKTKAKSFTVTGEFNDKEIFDALQKAGLSGKIAK